MSRIHCLRENLKFNCFVLLGLYLFDCIFGIFCFLELWFSFWPYMKRIPLILLKNFNSAEMNFCSLFTMNFQHFCLQNYSTNFNQTLKWREITAVPLSKGNKIVKLDGQLLPHEPSFLQMKVYYSFLSKRKQYHTECLVLRNFFLTGVCIKKFCSS